MIYEHTELRVRPGDGPWLTTDFAGVRHLLLQSPGCVSAELIRGVDHPDTYLLRVGWERLEDHAETFPATPQSDVIANAIAAHCIAPPRIVHYASPDQKSTGETQ
ncbi:antibiotic biosynthesis monooxygenase [Nocardia sp. NBC_01730]|uniref:antibiotic biosynthesis monooxygenase family protein n=1 Tax=Nocardia sp. NBC_01730 TaxID=2975998 RepID=UPI002E0F0B05|nr:antibiotic biosynthesis monooxygenase [Nocardia sp. NBC_01730]